MSDAQLVHCPDPHREQGAQGEEPPRAEWTEDGARGGKEERDLRRLLIAEMLLAHVPYRTIATRVGISKSMVAKEVKVIRAEWKERAGRAFDSHVEEELGKIEALERYVLAEAMHGGKAGGTNLAAVDRALSLMDRRAKLLGLDKPTKIEHSGEIEIAAQQQRAHELADELERKRQQKSA